jgi:hypothetical protein
MRFFKKSYDGGLDSGVTGYWLIEWKAGFSIVLLHFSPGSREAYHSHAFNAVTWWLRGEVMEQVDLGVVGYTKTWSPSIKPKFTPKHLMHRINAGRSGAWALSIRGPWEDTWQEKKHGETYTLTHGRRRVE